MKLDSPEASRFRELVRRSRSIRRFQESRPVSADVLRRLVDCARLVPSAANLQPLRYVLCNDPARRASVFACLKWAGYLKDWPGPAHGERPAAYLVMLSDREITREPWCDCGVAAQTITLYATALGLGACMLGAIDRDGLRRALNIDSRFDILLVIALGFPAETVVVTEVDAEHGVRYWRDAAGIHHVPKRRLDELIVQEFVTD